MLRSTVAFLVLGLISALAQATCSVSNTLTNGTTADATQVMGNFSDLENCVNTLLTGNVTLGTNSGNGLTINSGAWAINSDYTATRAAGTLASGGVFGEVHKNTWAGNSAGNNDYKPFVFESILSGNNPATQLITSYNQAIHSGTGNLINMYGVSSIPQLTGSGNVTTAAAFQSALLLSSTGAATTGMDFWAASPILTSTGSIATHVGFRASNLGNATLTTNVYAFLADDQTAGTGITAGYVSSVSSGTNKWNFYAGGTAGNLFNGPVHIGTNVTFSPTVPTISSGFGTTPTITGTATAFRINVGTGTSIGSINAGVITLPTATNGWNCFVNNLSAKNGNRADQTVQTDITSNTNVLHLQNQTAGAATAWTDSDLLAVNCTAF